MAGMEEQMNHLMNKGKGIVAAMMMACLLLTMSSVSSNAEDGIAVCGEAFIAKKGESN